MIRIELQGADKLRKAGDTMVAWQEMFHSKVAAEVRFFGEAVVGTSRQRYLSGRPGLNVVTGRLRSSINYLVKSTEDGFILNVGTNVPYAPVHEFGDVRGFIRPRPFLKPAVEDEYGGFVDNVEKVLREFTEVKFGQ